MADSSNIDEFVIAVRLETDKIQQDFSKLSNEMKKSADGIKGKFDKIFSPNQLQKDLSKNTELIKTATLNIGKILTGGLGTIGATLGTKFALDFIKNMTSQAHGTELIAKAYGTSPKQVQLLQEVYKRLGGTAENASGVIAQFASRLRSGTVDPAQQSALSELGIKTDKANRDPVNTILEALQKIGSGGYTAVQRGSLVQRLGLGTEGMAAVNDPKSFQGYIKKVQKDLLNNTDNSQLAQLDKRFQDLGERWNKIQMTVLTGIVPSLEKLTDVVEAILHPLDTAKAINKSIKVTKGDGFTSRIDKFGSQSPLDMAKSFKPLFESSSYGAGKKKSLQPKIDDSFFKEYNTKDINSDVMVPPIMVSPNYFQNQQKKSKQYQSHETPNPTNMNNQVYLDKVKRGGFIMEKSIANKHTAINHHNQVSYNMDNIHLHEVSSPRQFINEMDMLRNTAFNSGRNQIA